jgi:hypothetical protein
MSITRMSLLMESKEITTVYSDNYMKPIDNPCGLKAHSGRFHVQECGKIRVKQSIPVTGPASPYMR